MKKLSIILLVLFILFSFFSCNEKSNVNNEISKGEMTTNAPELSGIESLLPASSIAVIKVRDLKLFYNIIVPKLNLATEDMKEAIEAIEFDPLKVEELNEFGVDHSREFGVVLNDFDVTDETFKDPPVFNMTFFVPVIEGKGLIEKIGKLIKKKKPEFKFEQSDGFYIFPTKETEPKVIAKEINGYVFLTIAYKSDEKKFFNEMGKTPLSTLPLYKKLITKLGVDHNMLFFGNIENAKFLSSLSKSFKKKFNNGSGFSGLDFFEGYKGFLMGINIDGPDMLMNAYGVISEDAPVMALYKGVKSCKNTVLGIKESPLLYFSFGVNPGEYYKMIKKSFTDSQIAKFDSSVEEFKVKTGINLHEIIDNLGGNFNYGMYDGSGINIASYNTVFSLSVKDETKGKALLEKLIEALKSKAGDKITLKKEDILNVGTLIISAPPAQFYIGFKDSALIFSTNKSYYEQAITGKIETGFTANMEKDLAEKFIKGDVFYLSFDEGLKAFENFKPFLMMGMAKKEENNDKGNSWVDKITSTVNEFQYIMSSTIKNDDGLFAMNFILKTRFKKSFTEGIIDIIKSFEKKEVLQ